MKIINIIYSAKEGELNNPKNLLERVWFAANGKDQKAGIRAIMIALADDGEIALEDAIEQVLLRTPEVFPLDWRPRTDWDVSVPQRQAIKEINRRLMLQVDHIVVAKIIAETREYLALAQARSSAS